VSGPRPTIAVGYARRSTDMQERSIPDQRAFVERWAKEHGYRVVRWYVDDAISGTSAKGRAAFERMLKDAEGGGGFAAVLCYDMSRFSRGGTNETGYYLHRLQLAGVDTVFCAEGIPEGEEGELLQGVKSWQARQYSVKLSRDTIRGTISHIMQKQCAPGGRPPYGYDKQHCTASGQALRTFRWLPDGRKQEFGPDGALIRVLDPGESVKKAKSDIVRYVPGAPDRVEVVRRMFAWCIDGFGYHYIAARLNEEGVPSVDGAKWNSSQIKRLLENPAYRGAVAWNRRTLGKLNGVAGDGTLRPKRAGGGQSNNDQDDWFVVEDAHEALVPPDMFERARRGVEGRRDQGGLAKPINRSLLSGLIICANCGHHFLQKHVNSMSGGRRVRYRYYTDGGYNRGGRGVCVLSNIPADALDGFVVGRLREVLLGRAGDAAEAIDTFVDAVTARWAGGDGDDDPGVEKELDAVNRRIKQTIAMLADPAFDGLDELKATLADLKKRRDALRARLDRPRARRAPALNEKDLRRWARDRFQHLAEIGGRGEATPETRRLVHAYIDRIEIDPLARRGTLHLPADAFACLERELSSSAAHGDPRGGVKAKGEA